MSVFSISQFSLVPLKVKGQKGNENTLNFSPSERTTSEEQRVTTNERLNFSLLYDYVTTCVYLSRVERGGGKFLFSEKI